MPSKYQVFDARKGTREINARFRLGLRVHFHSNKHSPFHTFHVTAVLSHKLHEISFTSEYELRCPAMTRIGVICYLCWPSGKVSNHSYMDFDRGCTRAIGNHLALHRSFESCSYPHDVQCFAGLLFSWLKMVSHPLFP